MQQRIAVPEGWKLFSEYYEQYIDPPVVDTLAAFAECKSQPNGFLFLESSTGGQLQLQFDSDHGVCEYSKYESETFLYAVTPNQLSGDMPHSKRLTQCCNCCAVGMHWYPPKCHMPRVQAIAIVESMLQSGGRPASVTVDSVPIQIQWFDLSGFRDEEWD